VAGQVSPDMFALQNASLQLGFNFKEGVQGVRAMVFNATFNNISVLSWRSVLFIKKLDGAKFKPSSPGKKVSNILFSDLILL
jgi:hypothetical protein